MLGNISKTIEFALQMKSIAISAHQGARLAATLANNGACCVDPLRWVVLRSSAFALCSKLGVRFLVLFSVLFLFLSMCCLILFRSLSCVPCSFALFVCYEFIFCFVVLLEVAFCISQRFSSHLLFTVQYVLGCFALQGCPGAYESRLSSSWSFQHGSFL